MVSSPVCTTVIRCVFFCRGGGGGTVRTHSLRTPHSPRISSPAPPGDTSAVPGVCGWVDVCVCVGVGVGVGVCGCMCVWVCAWVCAWVCVCMCGCECYVCGCMYMCLGMGGGCT